MLESGLNTTSIIATVQLEVAQRIVATPGDLSLLAVSVLFYGTPELLFKIPSSAFKPQPGVDSAVLRITPLAVPYSVAANDFFKVARAGFSQARKQLRNPLSSGLGLPKAQIEQILHEANIDPTAHRYTKMNWRRTYGFNVSSWPLRIIVVIFPVLNTVLRFHFGSLVAVC